MSISAAGGGGGQGRGRGGGWVGGEGGEEGRGGGGRGGRGRGREGRVPTASGASRPVLSTVSGKSLCGRRPQRPLARDTAAYDL